MSRIEDMTVELGVNLSQSVLRPEPGDLLVLKCESYLSTEQRERFEANVLPPFLALGCKVIILEGGTDVQLIKKAATAEPDAETGVESVSFSPLANRHPRPASAPLGSRVADDPAQS